MSKLSPRFQVQKRNKSERVMKQLYRPISVYLLMAALSVGAAVAQKDTTRLNQSVEVMKAYHPSISNANKVNLMPVIEDTTRFSPEFNYSIDNYPVKKGFAASPIAAADVNKYVRKVFEQLPCLDFLLTSGTPDSCYNIKVFNISTGIGEPWNLILSSQFIFSFQPFIKSSGSN